MRILPLEPNGWSSKSLKFGKRITQLHGPNGSGKTPLIQSLVHCLGFPVKFRDDIYQKCRAVRLDLEIDGIEYAIERDLDSQFSVVVNSSDGDDQKFFNERDFSRYLFELFDISYPQLVSVGNKPTPPYLATLLPIFYLDQDHGYSEFYRSSNRFIKDQYAEMLRLLFGLPPKNPFERKQTRIKLNESVRKFDRDIVAQKETIQELVDDIGANGRSIEELQRDIDRYRAELEQLSSSRDLRSDSLGSINTLIYDKKEFYRELCNSIDEHALRVKGIIKIRNEIDIEINTLGLNEEARRLFHSFEDICSNPKCGLFVGSSESYGKNLLYLKDQIKDLVRNADVLEIKVSELEKQKKLHEKELQSMIAQRDGIDSSSDASALIGAIGNITGEVHKLESARKLAEILQAEEKRYVELVALRENAQNNLADLGGSRGQGDLEILRIRSEMKRLIVKWLDVLKTKNVSRDISVDYDFNPIFDNEKLEQFKGSTRVRVVLAVHAAILEIYLSNKSNKLRFFILDTPKQQEMQTEHLEDYFESLKSLASEFGAQVVISTTEYRCQSGTDDIDWLPDFEGPEQNMFLG